MKQRTSIVSALCILGATLSLGLASCEANTLAEDSFVQPSDWSTGVKSTDGWVMAWIGTGQTAAADCLHLSYSTDGYTWVSLNSGAGIYTSTIGSGHIRDPFIFRKNDGTFVLLASNFTKSGDYTEAGSRYDLSYWGHPSQSIYIAESSDLITWKNERLLQVTNGYGTSGAVRHAWSPKALYDENRKAYVIYWVGDDNDGVNSTYETLTYDFVTVKDLDAQVLYDPGYSQTASTITSWNGTNYMFYRDDDVNLASGSGGDIQVATSDSLYAGSFTQQSARYINRVTSQSTVVYADDPCIYKIPDESTWILIATLTNSLGSYTCLTSDDITSPESWEAVSATMTLPTGRCLNVVRVTSDELTALDAAY